MNILLHVCCGICAAGVAERLQSEGHHLTGYFYNPNIFPYDEYRHRAVEAIKVAKTLKFPIEIVPYETADWTEATSSLASEPEGGKRCEVCYRIRLQATFVKTMHLGLDAFTTTLTVSPHKSAALINELGKTIGGDMFLARDFKKKNGFLRANELARQFELYRQEYCGCAYGKRKATG